MVTRQPALAMRHPIEISVLGGFELRLDGQRVAVPAAGQRVLALLALRGRSLRRPYLAGILWPDVSDDHAAASLRSALWRMPQRDRLLVVQATLIRLADGVQVDLPAAVAVARGLANTPTPQVRTWVDSFGRELLPDWYDEWLDEPRESWRQTRLHALERASAVLSAAGDHAEALQAALAAVHIEPLRESAHRALIQAHLDESNPSEAVRAYLTYRTLLRDEMALDPSPAIQGLVLPVFRDLMAVGPGRPDADPVTHRGVAARGDGSTARRSPGGSTR